ncbi:MAG TPA: hypothetical protein VHT04_07315, partial [Stellaceae bacterium]|nr:hypothetical protein [Stellaceae bacterium]
MTGSSVKMIGAALAAMCLLAAASASAQTAAPVRVRGTIASINGQDLTVKSRDGNTVAIKLAPDVAVTAVVKADMS